MLSKQDNEDLVRVGPGTVTGELLRQYWLPILLSSELKSHDSDPLRARLLCEDLIAFRDSSGQVGLVANHCPHRGASLFFGRNEENGLRCVYHGWKFDVHGACVDMPNEPAESNFKDKVRTTAYPCRERNGMIWAYMGPRTEPPEPPDFEWNLVPEDQRYIDKTLQESNWAQAAEGGIDTSHGSFLHAGLVPGQKQPTDSLFRRDHAPRFEVVYTNYGLLIGAQRDFDAERYSYGITQFLMPFYSMVPGGLAVGRTLHGHAWVPMDDEHTMTWTMSWSPDRKLSAQELQNYRTYPQSGIHVGPNGLLPATSKPMGAWRPIANRSNDYQIDREAQRSKYYTGIGGPQIGNTRLQDGAVQESMGPIFDRSQERLGTTDLAIIRARAMWLGDGRALRDNATPPTGVDDHKAYAVRSYALLVPRTAPERWVEASHEGVTARPGQPATWGELQPKPIAG